MWRHLTVAFNCVSFVLGGAGSVYLDHAGATLYSEAQMADVVKDLTSNVYGNPRILSPCSSEALFCFF
jgi:hypothetical protein